MMDGCFFSGSKLRTKLDTIIFHFCGNRLFTSAYVKKNKKDMILMVTM